MRQRRLKYLLVPLIIFCTTMCRKSYEPPAIKSSSHFLAIDGIINTGVFSSSTFTVTRSMSLLDSLPDIPELNATVEIQAENGFIYHLSDTANNGIYVSELLNLDQGQKYRLAVSTSDGNKYESDFVTPKVSPPVDSLNWELLYDPVAGTDVVNIYVNSHDETNNTRYYRWEYLETWQHRSENETIWGLNNGLLYPIEPVESTYNCWTTAHSNNILLGSSIALSSDVIRQIKIASFLKNDPRLDIKYSLLVRQFPLDFESYNYWLTVQKNSQSLGGLFDLQPSQINGNFHSVTNPGDPVLGLVSASSVQEKRVFISNRDLPGWESKPSRYCPIVEYPADPLNTLVYNYADTSFALWYFTTGPTMRLTKKNCLDCRREGGTNIKPPYWQ